ncbi:MAG: hypothetical protein JWN00_5826 [Actinomycetia bacterium]|nr:hypothetical protein [Actinomycetes bacterium]
MRRIAALALSATALCTVLATTTGAANASVGDYGSTSYASSNARVVHPKPIGAKHYFHDTDIPGVKVMGDWYRAKLSSGKIGIWLDTVLYDTKKDGKAVAMFFTLGGKPGAWIDAKGGGTTVAASGFIPVSAGFSYRTERGVWKSPTFFYDQRSAIHKVR